MRIRATMTIMAAVWSGCRNEGGVAAPVNEWGEPNPQELTNPVQVDRIAQTTIPSVDVLFVVDNSCSMSEEQLALSTNFPTMLDWFIGSGLDYHVGVVSTDMNNPLEAGRLRTIAGRRWIQDDTASPEGVFGQMVEMGTSGHWEEKGRAAAYTALELLSGTDNLGFVRDGAGMHITVVSDENDASGDSPISRNEWIDYLQDFRWSRRLVSFSSIVGPVTGCPYIGSPGTEYTSVTDAVGGVTWPICSDDWTEVLDQLGFLAVGLSREFYLSRLPVASTIAVSVDDAGVVVPFDDGEWTYDASRNSVTFDSFVPEPLAVVQIEYQVLASVNDPGAIEDPTPPN
ncbi:MAG: hypothetical protein ABMB14_26895 [Myxococcota bacterium]